MAGPNLPDIQTLIQMGINPKTGLPMKFGSRRIDTKDDIRKLLERMIDKLQLIDLLGKTYLRTLVVKS